MLHRVSLCYSISDLIEVCYSVLDLSSFLVCYSLLLCNCDSKIAAGSLFAAVSSPSVHKCEDSSVRIPSLGGGSHFFEPDPSKTSPS